MLSCIILIRNHWGGVLWNLLLMNSIYLSKMKQKSYIISVNNIYLLLVSDVFIQFCLKCRAIGQSDGVPRINLTFGRNIKAFDGKLGKKFRC